MVSLRRLIRANTAKSAVVVGQRLPCAAYVATTLLLLFSLSLVLSETKRGKDMVKTWNDLTTRRSQFGSRKRADMCSAWTDIVLMRKVMLGTSRNSCLACGILELAKHSLLSGGLPQRCQMLHQTTFTRCAFKWQRMQAEADRYVLRHCCQNFWDRHDASWCVRYDIMLRKATSLLSHWAVTRWHPTQVCKVCGGRPLLGIRSFVILVLNMSGVMLALKHCIIPRIIDRHQFEVSRRFDFHQLSKCVIVHICSICFKLSHTWLDVLSYFQIWIYIYISDA